jgi:hypothetical protein
VREKGEVERGGNRTGNIINVLIDNDVHATRGIFVGCDIRYGKGFRHLEQLPLSSFPFFSN